MRNPPLQKDKVRLETCPRSQRGQSLVEMAIACMVLVPLFVGVIFLGQYIHLRQQTQAAARAAAWDAAVSPSIVNSVGGLPSQSGAQDRMRALQFGKPGATLVKISAPTRLQDPMLTTFAGRDLVLAQSVTLPTGTYTNSTSPGLLEATLRKVGVLTKLVGGKFPPDVNGLITAEVHAKPERATNTAGRPATFLNPLDTLNLDFYGRTVLLADAWNANGPGEDGNGTDTQVLRSVRGTVGPLALVNVIPSSLLKGIDGIAGTLGKLPVANQLITAGWGPEFGRTAPDAVPSDRLQQYGATH
jgi:hypothetical protein